MWPKRYNEPLTAIKFLSEPFTARKVSLCALLVSSLQVFRLGAPRKLMVSMHQRPQVQGSGCTLLDNTVDGSEIR